MNRSEDLPDAIFECEECGMRGDLSNDFNYDVDGDSEGWYPSTSCSNCGERMSPSFVGLERDGVKKRPFDPNLDCPKDGCSFLMGDHDLNNEGIPIHEQSTEWEDPRRCAADVRREEEKDERATR